MDFRYQAAIARALRPVRRAGARLQGQEAGPLVHPLPHRARRSRGRVRGSHRRRRSTSSSRWRPRARASSARASRRWPAGRSRCSSGRRRRGRFRRTWRSRFIPEFDYAAYDVDGRAGDRRRGAGADGRARRSAAPFGEPVARMKGEQLERIRFRHPLYDARLARRARRVRHARRGHRRRAHGARATAPTTSTPA